MHNRAGLADVEIELSDAGTANGLRQPVTDMVLFASRRGMEIGKLLAAADGALPQDEGGVPSRSLFTVRLFVVAGGRLYTGIKGQCSVWANNVSRCTTSCDGGTFAVRRRGSAPLELLLGAVPGGDAGEAGGLDTTGCAIEEGASARLVPKAGRGLAVIGFGTE